MIMIYKKRIIRFKVIDPQGLKVLRNRVRTSIRAQERRMSPVIEKNHLLKSIIIIRSLTRSKEEMSMMKTEATKILGQISLKIRK